MHSNFFKTAVVLGGFLLVPALMQAQGTDPLPPPPSTLTPTPPPAACTSGTETANTWCTISMPTGFPGTMMLLTDGRVMIQDNGGTAGECGPDWKLLTPAANGDYGTGTWTTTASMATPRLYFGSEVMQNGKVWVLGGEYSGPSCSSSGATEIIATGEIYDPAADTWTAVTTYPLTASCNSFRGGTGEACFGDDPSILLPGGNILAGDIFTATPMIWTPSASATGAPGTWALAGTKVYADRSDEEGWMKLPNGNVVVYDLFQSITDGAGRAEMYTPGGAGTWANITPTFNGNTGTLPVMSSGALGDEMGPGMRLQDGRLFIVGANQHTALYNSTTKVWAAGPDTIGPAITGTCLSSCNYGADDAPAAELPTGHIIYAADAGVSKTIFSAPVCLFDFNPATNTTSLMSPQPPNGLAGSTCDTPAAANNSFSAYYLRMLMLPTGQMLFNDFGSSGAVVYLYTPTSRNAALPYRPVVQSVTGTRPTLTVTGLQLNGPSAGADYGDDANMDENFPVVRLVNAAGTLTYYCTTTAWSSVAVGNVGAETVTVTVPAGVPSGSYTLIVSGAGVQSVPVAVTM